MASMITPLINFEDIKTTRLDAFAKRPPHLHFYYDDLMDEVIILFVPPEVETSIYYVDEHIGLILETETNEIVGFMIDHLQRCFIPTFSLKEAWTLSKVIAPKDTIWDFTLEARELQRVFAHRAVEAAATVIGKPAEKLSLALEPA